MTEPKPELLGTMFELRVYSTDPDERAIVAELLEQLATRLGGINGIPVKAREQGTFGYDPTEVEL